MVHCVQSLCVYGLAVLRDIHPARKYQIYLASFTHGTALTEFQLCTDDRN